ncbi:MAG: DUF4105 domain-containing protein [Acidobacteriota bacterium]|nr:DUF4105 domain-containing protein [Acidobacteriota bacterium]MDH3786492.1 DUF4105 domain-containing protein [Acidobacteriota bacterium]
MQQEDVHPTRTPTGFVRKALRRAALVALLGAIVLFLWVALRTPSLTRDWDEDVRVLAGVERSDGGTVLLKNVRDWSYTRDSVVGKSYIDASYNPERIVDLWLYEQKLDDVGLVAHTFVVFEFDESHGPDRFLGLSVETRREVGEKYSLIGGIVRSFEVTHIWATENDLVTRRVNFLDYPLTRHRLTLPAEVRTRIFYKFVEETEELAATPRWYSTMTNNCTSSLIRYVNQSEPGALPRHYSYVLTGTVDAYLKRLGYLDTEHSQAITRDTLITIGIR